MHKVPNMEKVHILIGLLVMDYGKLWKILKKFLQGVKLPTHPEPVALLNISKLDDFMYGLVLAYVRSTKLHIVKV